MQEFTRRSRLRALPPESRLVYSGFVLFSWLGLVSAVLLYENSLGASLRQTAEYYLGAQGDELAVPKSYRALLETTHFHLFTMPVIWLILVHLFLLVPGRPAAKRAWVATSFLAVLTHVAGPWLVRYGGPALSFVMPLTGLALVVSFFWLGARGLWEMWAPR